MVVVAGLAVSLGRFSRASDGDRALTRRIFATAPMDAPLTPILLNDAAWMIAIDPEAEPLDLEAALEAAERAVAAYPDEGPTGHEAVVDTQATLLFRLGRYREAVAVERGVFEGVPESVYAAQLARFLRAAVERDGPILVGEPPALGLDYAAPSVRMTLEGELPNGLVFYALVMKDGDMIGLVRGSAPPGTALPSRHGLGGEPFSEGTSLVIGLVDAAPEPAPAGSFAMTRSSLDAEVLGYP
jgi:hypothetical protein